MRSAAVALLIVTAAAAQPPPDSARGEAIYTSQCAICHGQRGEGGRGATLARPKLRHAPDDETLQRVIRRGLAGTGMPATWLNEGELRDVAAHVRSLGRVTPAAIPGDARRGEAIYNGKGGCARCHTINGRGGAFGPDLTAIGARRNAAHLRESLINPAAGVAASFVLIRAVARDGRGITGARVNEDTFSIQLRDAGGTLFSFWKTELRELHKEPGKSAMPSYAASLTPPELDDLVAYLAGLQEVQ